MRVKTVEKTLELARLFAREAEALAKLTRAEGNNELIFGNKLSGRVRRLSMDLTRALAEMRKP